MQRPARQLGPMSSLFLLPRCQCTYYFQFSANIDKRSGGGSKKQSYGSGRQTLRFKANGSAKVEEVDDARTLAEEKINELLEGFLGINDAELCKYLVCICWPLDFLAR